MTPWDVLPVPSVPANTGKTKEATDALGNVVDTIVHRIGQDLVNGWTFYLPFVGAWLGVHLLGWALDERERRSKPQQLKLW